MAQVQKAHVREALLVAARELGVEAGYPATTMAAVAARAGVATGNVYRYFPSKEALFAAAVPESLARELARRVRARVLSLGRAISVSTLPAEAPYRVVSEELFAFVARERLAVAFLLRGAEGTPHAGFAARLTADLVRLARRYAKAAHGRALGGHEVFALTRIYAAYVASLGEALVAFSDAEGLRAASDALARYHLAGLVALFAGPSRNLP